MSDIEMIKSSIFRAFGKLEDKDANDFDKTKAALTILSVSMQMIRDRYPAERLEKWKNQEETEASFLRFCSLLKNALDCKQEYLKSIISALNISDDKVFQKISEYSCIINKIKGEKESVLMKGEPLFEKERELQEQTRQVEELKIKIRKLSGVEQDLAKYNLNALNEEAEKLEKANFELEFKAKPLKAKVDALEKKHLEFQNYFEKLTNQHKRLASLSASEATQLADDMLGIIEQIRKRIIFREEKLSDYLKQLESDIYKLKSVEQKISDLLIQLEEVNNAFITNSDIMHVHFRSNNELCERFGRSLNDEIENLKALSSSIEKDLNKYDAELKELHKRIQDINAEFSPIGI